MTQFNPLSGAILQSPIVQQQQAGEKVSQIKRTQLLEKNIALEDDQMENQVESSDEVQPGRQARDDEHPSQRKPKKPFKGDDGHEHVDLTA